MYNVNDRIHYAGSGVCVIQEITSMRVGRVREKYYVLKPLHQNTSLIYVPIGNERLEAKMRPVLSAEEVRTLIDDMPAIETAWVEDPQERKAAFDELLRRQSCRDLVVIIKTLYQQKQRRQARGKSLHVSDDNYLREAQRLLYDEFAGALGMQPSEVHQYLQNRLEPSA